MLGESLAVVLDVNPSSFPELDPRGGDAAPTELSFKAWWIAACSFFLYYSQLFPSNQLIIIACHANTVKFLYRGEAGDFDAREATKALFTTVMPVWAADGISMVNVALSRAFASVMLTKRLEARILVLLTVAKQDHVHISEEVLRVVFAAAKHSVIIDSFCYAGKSAQVWQQASLHTGGLACSFGEHADPSNWQLPPAQTKELEKQSGLIVPIFLVFTFLGGKAWRSDFAATPTFSVENAAVCTCHTKRVMLGKLCTQCFSVYCSTVDECEACAALTSPP